MKKRQIEGYLRLNEMIKLGRARSVRRKTRQRIGCLAAGLPVIYGTYRNEEWARRLKEKLYSESF